MDIKIWAKYTVEKNTLWNKVSVRVTHPAIIMWALMTFEP